MASEQITVRIGECVRRGRAIELSVTVEPTAVVAAIRTDATGEVTVRCKDHQPVHEHVGYIHAAMGLRTRSALARAGRSRGLETTYDDELAAVRKELATLRDELEELPETATRTHRQTAAETTESVIKLREEVAAARGRLQFCRKHDLDTAAAAEELETKIRELSEARTTTTAATEQLESARSTQRKRRDIRDRQFTLEDRKANLERNARAELVDRLRDEFAEEIARVRKRCGFGSNEPADTEPFDADPVVAALAIVRIGELSAPVVIASEIFESAERAHSYLGTAVVQI